MLQDMPYPGGKGGAGVYQRIISLMPPHRVYIEPFLGGGAVFARKLPARVNIGVDLVASSNPAISAAIGVSGDEGPQILEASAKAAMRAASVDTVADGDRRSRMYIVRGDGIDFLRGFPFRGDELVYCDPPYLHSTRRDLKLYEYEMSDRDHRALLQVIRALPCSVMISGYHSAMYARALASWNSISYQAMTRAGRLATEWLWFNFEAGAELHDYRYIGRDFRERERIKRKKARWTARLQRMPALERQALLAAIGEAGFASSIVKSGAEVLG